MCKLVVFFLFLLLLRFNDDLVRRWLSTERKKKL